MTRRRAVAAGVLVLLVLLAGCSAAGSLDMQRVSDAELAAEASRPAAPVAGEPAPERRLVRQVVENGSATARGQSPPVESGLPFAYEGRYYDVSWTVTDRQPAMSASIVVDYNGTAPAARTVAYGHLSARDREAVGNLLPPRTDRRVEGYDFGTGSVYNATERNRSVLLAGTYDAVRFEGEAYPVAVDDSRPVTIETYRYTTTVVANGSEAYVRQLRETYLFTLSGLSDAEREVVAAAVEDDYYADGTDDEAFASVLERFRRHDAVEADDYRGTWLVRYEGEVYLAGLSYDGFADA